MPLHILDEANRCLECKNPTCQKGCPISTPIPEVIRLLKNNQLDEAGRILFENTVTPVGVLPVLPRIGASAILPAECSKVKWYGLGPWDTYSDRRASGRLGIYTAHVSDPLSYYVKPQECGSKTGTVYMCLTNDAGEGFAAFGEAPYIMSALPYTAEEIGKMRHTPDLSICDKVVLTVDCAQNGLGNRSCGPDVLARYRLQPYRTIYAYTFMHVKSDEDNFRARYPGWLEYCPPDINNSYICSESDEEYRDPSDEDIRAKAGFDTAK